MRDSTSGVALAIIVLLVGTPARGREDKPATLDGEWEVVGMVYKGKEQKIPAASDRPTWKIKGRELIQRFPATPKPDNELPVKEIVLRSDKQPKEIDLFMPEVKEPFRGIFEVKDGKLTIVLAQRDQERPTRFDATKDVKVTSYTLQKLQK